MTEPQILSPDEVIGGAILRANAANTEAGEQVVKVKLTTNEVTHLVCSSCGHETELDEMDGPMLAFEVRGWERHNVAVWFEEGEMRVDPDWYDGPEDTDWTGEAAVSCLMCGAEEPFSFDPHHDWRAREKQIGAGVQRLWVPRARDPEEEEEE